MEAAHESVPRAGDRGEEEKAGEEVVGASVSVGAEVSDRLMPGV